MTNEKLVEWARSSLHNGYSTSQIKNALLKKEYDPEIVDELIDEISKPKTLGLLEAPHPAHNYAALAAGLFIVVLVFTVVTYIHLTSKSSLEADKTPGFSQNAQTTQSQQATQENQEATARELENASGNLKDLGSIF
ncbi:hypothetical protein HYX00_02555 [Candidatus Woesearchaeota archaeon]|nr:hypothetical protein [Candidatus Woesearchaeota archaeon]